MNDSLTASIVSGFRNVGLGFVLLSGMAGKTTAEYVGVSQIPIFLAPLGLEPVRAQPALLFPAGHNCLNHVPGLCIAGKNVVGTGSN